MRGRERERGGGEGGGGGGGGGERRGKEIQALHLFGYVFGGPASGCQLGWGLGRRWGGGAHRCNKAW